MKNKFLGVEQLKIITIFFISWGIVELGFPFWIGFLLFFYLFNIKIPPLSLFWVAVAMFLRSLQIASWGEFDEKTHLFLVLGVFFMLVSSCIEANWFKLGIDLLFFLGLVYVISYILSENSFMGLLAASPLAILAISRTRERDKKPSTGLLACSLGIFFLVYMKTNYFNAFLADDERILWLTLSSCLFWGVSELILSLKLHPASRSS